MADVYEKMSIARATMVQKHAFFASLLLNSPFIETDELPTAATDGKKIYWNPKFFEQLSVDETVGILGHEILHIVDLHIERIGARDKQLANIAADLAINPILMECGFTLPQGALYDKKYEGWSMEAIYEDLEKNAEKSKSKFSGGLDDLQPDDKGSSGGGQMTELEKSQMRSEIKQKVAQAATMAKMTGQMPAGLQRLVDELLNPKVPWAQVLREYLLATVKDDESWNRRNRRFTDYYLPARHSEAMGEIVIIGDTSGSIGPEELKEIATEINGIKSQLNPERIRVLWCDTQVAGEQVFEQGEDLHFEPAGGGGTDMRVGINEAAKYDPIVVVLMTDGYTPWPEIEPDFPLIVLCTTDVECPVGTVIRLK